MYDNINTIKCLSEISRFSEIDKLVQLRDVSYVSYLSSTGTNILSDWILPHCAQFGYGPTVRYLVKKGADIHTIRLASINGHDSIVKYLSGLQT